MVAAIIEPDTSQRVVYAKIVSQTNNSDPCDALLDERKANNIEQEKCFYVLSASPPVNLGIVKLSHEKHVSRSEMLDINNDGRRKTFHYCHTSEGIRFSIWEAFPARAKNDGAIIIIWDMIWRPPVRDRQTTALDESAADKIILQRYRFIF